MLRWHDGKKVEVESVDRFLLEIIEVCKKHGFSVSHEDVHGAFEVERFNEHDREWLFDASLTDSVMGGE